MTKAYRLPSHVRPIEYDLHLHARVDASTFRGEVRIHLLLERASDRVELHARDLRVWEARIGSVGSTTVGARVERQDDAEVLVIVSPRSIPAGEAELILSFEGKVSTNMESLYLSKDGAEECLATQCEETDARGIFPCFDEPAFKARFRVSVTTSADVVVLANGALAAKEDADGACTWRFQPTAPMSSYLFALAIGRFASTSERVVRGVPMRVQALHGKEKLGEYGNEFAARLMPWFEDYFGARYHFAKYDQVAVPSFSAGAMENSGLVIFRQSLLLRDARTTSWQQEKLIARVIAHEFAHQWFGNLVTMQWWDDIWLNESFAEWMAHKAADAVAPHYALWADFHHNKKEALVTDALATTHAIYTHVETPEEATELFDTVTYSKGSVLMRMIERYLGEEVFRAGLRTYMREFAEKNARGDDLWRHLGAASGEPVTELAQSWILQPGYPLVNASLEGRSLKLSQRRFYARPSSPPDDQTWAIPLVLRVKDEGGVREIPFTFRERETTIELPLRGRLEWLHLNADGVGFYRQDLSADLQARLVRHAAELSASEQRDLLEDAWALAQAGRRPLTDLLELLPAIVANAQDHHVLAQALASVEDVEELLLDAKNEPALSAFRAFVGSLFAPDAARLGTLPRAGEPRDASERRALVMRALARHARDPRMLATAVALADAEITDPAGVDSTLAGPAVALAARFGDATRHARHLAAYETRRAAGAAPALVQRHLQSLVLFEDPVVLGRTLGLMKEGRFPLEALGPLLRAMLSEPHARLAAWQWMKENWRTVRDRLGDMWTGFLVEHTGALPVSERADIVGFYDANLQGVAQQSYARALETLDTRAEFERRVTPSIAAWLTAP